MTTIPTEFLGALFPVLWKLTQWLKSVPRLKKVDPVAILVSMSVIITTVFYVLPVNIQQYILTVAIPVGTATVFYEAKKISDAVK